MLHPFKTKSLLLFHFNICSLPKKIDNFHILLNELNINLDIIAISKSHIEENVPCPVNIQLANYSTEYTPNEYSTGGAFLCINNRLSCTPRVDLKMYAPGKLESLFTKIICPNTSNLIIV